jgi:hypothetical protein
MVGHPAGPLRQRSGTSLKPLHARPPRRPRPNARGPFEPLNRLLAGMLVAALLGACSNAPGGPPLATAPASPQPSTSSVTSPAISQSSPAPSWTPPSEPIAFTSDRYGYAISLPAGWYVREEAPGLWTSYSLNYVGPGTDSFEEDYPGRGDPALDYPGVTFGIYISSYKASGETLDSWTDALARTTKNSSSCKDEPDTEQITVGDEPATLLVYDRSDCTHDHHVLLVGVLHGSSGYAITWLGRRGEADARREDFEEILRTFRFT